MQVNSSGLLYFVSPDHTVPKIQHKSASGSSTNVIDNIATKVTVNGSTYSASDLGVVNLGTIGGGVKAYNALSTGTAGNTSEFYFLIINAGSDTTAPINQLLSAYPNASTGAMALVYNTGYASTSNYRLRVLQKGSSTWSYLA